MISSEFYDVIAPSYDELYGEEQVKKAKMVLREVLKKKHGGRLLDVGGGSGVATRVFAGYFECMIVDPSQGLLSLVPPGIRKVVGSAEALPFQDGEFDVVVSLTALHHTDMERALPEMKRVAKNNACVCISFLKKSPKINTLRSYVNELFSQVKEIEEEKDVIFVVS